MPWDPQQYLKFPGPRLRPGLDLLDRIPEFAPRAIVDLGCGAGQLTAQLARRWPAARMAGCDSSAEMLAQAATEFPEAEWLNLRWIQGDISSWRPEAPVDLIYSNAVLHWLDGHDALFPRLAGSVAPGGVFAVQMPRNFDQPSHLLLHRAVEEGPWRDEIELRAHPVLEPAAYYDLLSPLAASLDIWETEYLQVLSGEHPVLDWVKGTALRPVLDALSGDRLAQFLEVYGAALAAAYPKRPDGKTLFPFRRLFLIAQL